MQYNSEKHHRRSLRLKEYDYGQPGGYFVTLVAHNRQCIFAEFVNGDVALNEFGQIVTDEWNQSAVIRQEIQLDAFVVMPNHIHGIVIITNRGVGATGRSPLRPGPHKRSLSALLAVSNPLLLNVSMNFGAHLGCRSGNVTITNT